MPKYRKRYDYSKHPKAQRLVLELIQEHPNIPALAKKSGYWIQQLRSSAGRLGTGMGLPTAINILDAMGYEFVIRKKGTHDEFYEGVSDTDSNVS